MEVFCPEIADSSDITRGNLSYFTAPATKGFIIFCHICSCTPQSSLWCAKSVEFPFKPFFFCCCCFGITWDPPTSPLTSDILIINVNRAENCHIAAITHECFLIFVCVINAYVDTMALFTISRDILISFQDTVNREGWGSCLSLFSCSCNFFYLLFIFCL